MKPKHILTLGNVINVDWGKYHFFLSVVPHRSYNRTTGITYEQQNVITQSPSNYMCDIF